MGGLEEGKKTRRLRHRFFGEEGGDPCDLHVELDLVGLQPEASKLLVAGEVLQVELVAMDNAVSVICRTANGRVVGALAAFRGLAQLITCIRQGVEYGASVIEASSTRCSVYVSRVKP